MFKRDFELLNEKYNKEVLKENLGLGPQAISSDHENLTKVEHMCPYAVKGCKCNSCDECKANQSKEEGCEECGGDCGTEKENTDSDSYMAKQLLYRTFKLAAMLYGLMTGGQKVEAWVLSKITNAHDNLNSAFSYKDFEKFKQEMLNAGGLKGMGPITSDADIQPITVDEQAEIDLINSINLGSDALLKLIKLFLTKESKETKEIVLTEVIKSLS